MELVLVSKKNNKWQITLIFYQLGIKIHSTAKDLPPTTKNTVEKNFMKMQTYNTPTSQVKLMVISLLFVVKLNY